jgi:hypothetical protein
MKCPFKEANEETTKDRDIKTRGACFDENYYFAVRRSFMASQICRFFGSGATLQSMISSIVR